MKQILASLRKFVWTTYTQGGLQNDSQHSKVDYEQFEFINAETKSSVQQELLLKLWKLDLKELIFNKSKPLCIHFHFHHLKMYKIEPLLFQSHYVLFHFLASFIPHHPVTLWISFQVTKPCALILSTDNQRISKSVLWLEFWLRRNFPPLPSPSTNSEFLGYCSLTDNQFMSVIIHFDNVLPPSDARCHLSWHWRYWRYLRVAFGFGLRLSLQSHMKCELLKLPLILSRSLSRMLNLLKCH